MGTTAVAQLWRATDIRRGSIRGVQVLAPEAMGHKAGFLAAAEILRDLTHANRVGVRDVIDVDGVPALVTEHVSGPSLATWMRIRSRTTEDILSVFQDIVAGVSAVHGFDLLHLHLEPSRIWMHTRKGSFVPKVDLAFGPMATSGLRLGRIQAPEQALGQPVDARADLFLLGTVLYELLAGSAPYSESHAKLHPLIAAASCRPLGDVRGDLPRAVTDLVDRLLSPLADDRPSSAAELMRLLDGAIEPSSASEPAVLVSKSVPAPVPPASATGKRRLTDAAFVPADPPPARTAPRWTHPVAVASMVAAGLLSLAGALMITLGG